MKFSGAFFPCSYAEGEMIEKQGLAKWHPKRKLILNLSVIRTKN